MHQEGSKKERGGAASCGSDYANVSVRVPLCGGFTTQQRLDLA